jgi:hypothetical protein
MSGYGMGLGEGAHVIGQLMWCQFTTRLGYWLPKGSMSARTYSTVGYDTPEVMHPAFSARTAGAMPAGHSANRVDDHLAPARLPDPWPPLSRVRT